MNIGILIPGFGAGADDWALPVYQNLARELAKSHHVRVIALRYPHMRTPYTYHSVEVYPLGHGAWTRGLRRLRLWWDTAQCVKKLHQETPFDVLHGIWADETGALSGWIGKHLNIPSAVTVAGGELVGFPDIGYGLQLSRYSRWVVRQAIKHNTAIILPSDMNHLPLAKNLGQHVHHIRLGVDPTVFYPSDVERQPSHLVHVGSLIPVKNQKLLLDTLALLGDEITLDIIGEGHLESELKQYTEQIGLSQRVNFVGKVPHTELRHYYSRAQLHILTSRHEAFGMAVLEAAACGTPTVGTQVGLITDSPEITHYGENVDELAKHIQKLLNFASELEHLRLKCYEVVSERYKISSITEQYEEVYKRITSR